MKTKANPTLAAAAAPSASADIPTSSPAPSENWVRAVSDFLDTDPADLLSELGYYDRNRSATAPVSGNLK